MRLWHKDLISILPQKQLCGQWRECCLIAKAISEKGTPNHLLVNKVMNYNPVEFLIYSIDYVAGEMKSRGYAVDESKILKYFDKDTIDNFNAIEDIDDIFYGWHNEQYLRQCFYNLQEKYDCGGINDTEWQVIENQYELIRYKSYANVLCKPFVK